MVLAQFKGFVLRHTPAQLQPFESYVLAASVFLVAAIVTLLAKGLANLQKWREHDKLEKARYFYIAFHFRTNSIFFVVSALMCLPHPSRCLSAGEAERIVLV